MPATLCQYVLVTLLCLSIYRWLERLYIARTRRHRNANFPWRGAREPGPKRKNIRNFAFWRLRHQRRRGRESGFQHYSGRTASLKFIRDILFNLFPSVYSGVDSIFIDSGIIGLPSRTCAKILFYDRREYRGDSTIQENCKLFKRCFMVYWWSRLISEQNISGCLSSDHFKYGPHFTLQTTQCFS